MRATNFTAAMCVALLFTALDARAQQTVYKWVDKDGKVQFSDTPPPGEVKDSTAKRMGGGYVEEGQVPYATQIASQKNPVVLYASADCGELCDQGRALLGKRGIPFSEKDAKVKEVADEVKAMIGQVQVPVLKVGANTVKGYAEELWNNALDQAGYARERLPGQPGYKPQ
jgi:glutaredoxin